MSEVVKGLAETLKKLKALGDGIEKKVDAVTGANARELEATAKQYAPVDLGKLRQSIKTFKIADMEYKVLANATGLAPYAAYQEFGTGGLVNVPAELQDIAIKFKGRGVKKIDMRPQPFMYPALIRQRKIYLEDLEQLLKSETSKV